MKYKLPYECECDRHGNLQSDHRQFVRVRGDAVKWSLKTVIVFTSCEWTDRVTTEVCNGVKTGVWTSSNLERTSRV